MRFACGPRDERGEERERVGWGPTSAEKSESWGRGKAHRLRQGYGGPPKLYAKAEGRRAQREKRVGRP